MSAMSALAADATTIAGMGHNLPPEPTPFDAFDAHIADLFGEAKNFLDGAAISSDAEAEAVSRLVDEIRKANKDADAARSEEKKPHDEKAKAVQAKWRPLLDRCDLALDAAKKALSPWLLKLEQENRAKAEAARLEAVEAARVAQEAMQAAAATDLTARDAAETLVKAAKTADTLANRAEKQKAHAKGGGRAVGLRSTFAPVLTDPAAALAHYRARQPAALKAFLLQLAATDVLNGARDLPGFEIIEERGAV